MGSVCAGEKVSVSTPPAEDHKHYDAVRRVLVMGPSGTGKRSVSSRRVRDHSEPEAGMELYHHRLSGDVRVCVWDAPSDPQGGAETPHAADIDVLVFVVHASGETDTREKIPVAPATKKERVLVVVGEGEAPEVEGMVPSSVLRVPDLGPESLSDIWRHVDSTLQAPRAKHERW